MVWINQSRFNRLKFEIVRFVNDSQSYKHGLAAADLAKHKTAATSESDLVDLYNQYYLTHLWFLMKQNYFIFLLQFFDSNI